MALATKTDKQYSSSNMKKTKLKPSSNPNPFTFWFYFTISVSLVTLIFVTISSIFTQQDPKSWFLTLPTNLRTHFSNGRIIKLQLTPHTDSIELFTIQDGPLDSSSNLLIVHGLGCSSYVFSNLVNILGKKGVRVTALDLPGSGFSDKFDTVTEEKAISGFGRLVEMYNEIKEKGVFWGFDQLVEQGYVNYDYAENEIRKSKVETLKTIQLGPEEMGRVLGQVIETMGLAPVDLLLHDSAFGLGANWVSKNVGFIKSVTLLDSTSNQPAFPLWALKLPVVREVVLGFGFVFDKVIENCCSKSGSGSDSESHRLLLKGKNGRKSVVAMGNKMNSSFNVSEWGKLDGVKTLPMQVIWSSDWSEEWIKQGREVANLLPQATFDTHSGGRWPQKHTADELAESIHHFIDRLPKPVKMTKKKEPVPVNIREMLDEATAGVHPHGHGQEVAYPTGYGLGDNYS